jgi:hypothetical protein
MKLLEVMGTDYVFMVWCLTDQKDNFNAGIPPHHYTSPPRIGGLEV